MTYAVKELFATEQGEGFHQGRSAVFLRFTGCNLWSGLERDRTTAICQFCDTEFVGTDGLGGGRFASARALAAAAFDAWHHELPGHETPFAVLTGGEPLLQLDAPLIDALHAEGFEIAIETNGTLPVPGGVDWICVSPKAEANLVQTSGNELKLIYPQDGAPPVRYRDLDFQHFFLQPMDGADVERNTDLVIAYCRTHPEWNVSVQLHKYLGLR